MKRSRARCRTTRRALTLRSWSGKLISGHFSSNFSTLKLLSCARGEPRRYSNNGELWHAGSVPFTSGTSGGGPPRCATGEENGSNLSSGMQVSHGARPVRPITTMIRWIRTSRLSRKNSLSLCRYPNKGEVWDAPARAFVSGSATSDHVFWYRSTHALYP